MAAASIDVSSPNLLDPEPAPGWFHFRLNDEWLGHFKENHRLVKERPAGKGRPR